MRHIALVELQPYHTETLYSQLSFLRHKGYTVTLFCCDRHRAVIDTFRGDTEAFYFDTHSLGEIWRLRCAIIREGCDTVILNTAQGGRVLKFMLMPMPRRISVYGTIHETHKLTRSRGQKLISARIKGYYVLARYIDDNFPVKKPHTWFSPSFYPDYETIELGDRKKSDIWVSIPGSIENKRRDYGALLRLAQNPNLPDNVKFVLLGNSSIGDGPLFIRQAEEAGVSDRFIRFDNRVDGAEFYSYIKYSDFLMPVITPDTRAAEEYTVSKISGMFPLTHAFGIRMLCHELFSTVIHFDYSALFYRTDDELIEILKRGKHENAITPLSLDTEADRYVSLFENTQK